MPLPRSILRKRIRNEVALCKRKLIHAISVSDTNFENFPLEIHVTLLKTPGPIWEDEKVKHKFTHKIKIVVTENYPYEKPIVRWESRIFHPNIMLPEEGGYVCTKLLDDWNFNSNLMKFIKGLEALLINPNPKNPYGSDTCTRAAEYFNKYGYEPPMIRERSSKKPRIIGEG